MIERTFIQVGSSSTHELVLIRTPDEGSEGGYLVLRMSAQAARDLADKLETWPSDRPVVFSNGKRWAEQLLPDDAKAKLVSDLRKCADEAEGKNDN